MKDNGRSPLERIMYVSIPEETVRKAKNIPLDSTRLLPVEVLPGDDTWTTETLSWERILSAMFKILAWDPRHEDCDYYRKLIHALEPDAEFTMTKIGIDKAKNSDLAAAEEIFRSLVEYHRGNVNNFINLALVLEEQAELYEKLGNTELSEKYLSEAFVTYHEALEIHTSSPDLFFNLGNFYIKRKNLGKARSMLERFIALEPAGRRKEFARELLNKIPASPPEEMLLLEAYDFIQMKQEDIGIEKVQQFLKDQPDIWNAWFLLGWAYRRKEEYRAGKDALIKSIACDDTHVESYNELAVCLMELGDYRHCRQYLKKALTLDGENAETIINFGILALKEQNLSEAAGFFRTVLEYDPDNSTAQRYLSFISKNN